MNYCSNCNKKINDSTSELNLKAKLVELLRNPKYKETVDYGVSLRQSGKTLRLVHIADSDDVDELLITPDSEGTYKVRLKYGTKMGLVDYLGFARGDNHMEIRTGEEILAAVEEYLDYFND